MSNKQNGMMFTHNLPTLNMVCEALSGSQLTTQETQILKNGESINKSGINLYLSKYIDGDFVMLENKEDK